MGLDYRQVTHKVRRLGATLKAIASAPAAEHLETMPLPPEVESVADTEIPVTHPPIELPRPQFGHLPLSVINTGGWIRYGLVSDTHLCCKEERLAELHAQYDLFVAEGINTVFHAGNAIDGYVERINGESVFSNTIDGQCQYFSDNYPSRSGLTTYFITGDDHEIWFNKGFNIGAYMQFIAEKNGRTDLRYIGHVEADVAVQVGSAPRPTIIKIQHPGGGSAYSRSYIPQKIVESLEGGEKPDVLVMGHYHVSNYMQERNIHVVSLPGFKEQDVFSRKKRLRTEVGGSIMEFKVDPDTGCVTRFRIEINRYFNRGFYKRYLKSDVTLLKGRMVLNENV